jgi:UDP-glucose 4-epimerase
MKKAIVIGGSGFIGSHVADHLSETGYQVTIYDRTKSKWLRVDQNMVIGDVLDEEKLNCTIEGSEVVYNFAALADLNQALDQPLNTISVNILGNAKVMEACRIYGVKRFVYASTIYVHSREGGFYRCSKQASESYVEEYQRTYGLDYTILRYGSLYGPRADETNGLYRIVKSALATGVVKYEGHIDSMREYIHVHDAARASIDILGEKFRNESIVLTGQEPMRVLDLLKMLVEILGLPEDAVEFIDNNYAGHYVRTPYAYQPKLGHKFIPPVHVDLGQGILQVIKEIQAVEEPKSLSVDGENI